MVLSKEFIKENFTEHKPEYFFLNKFLIRLNAPSNTQAKHDLILISNNEDKFTNYICLSSPLLKLNKIFSTPLDNQLKSSPLEGSPVFLSKRLNLIMKSNKFKTFGILATNPRMDNFTNLFKRTKDILKHKNKRFYSFIMNKVNETKLRNFPEIEAFVMISCPFSSFLDTREFKLPIFSVQELLLFDNIEKIDVLDIVDFNSKDVMRIEEQIKLEDLQHDQGQECREVVLKDLQIMVNDHNYVDLRKLTHNQKLQLYNKEPHLVLNSFYKHYEYFENKNWKGLDKKIEIPIQKAKMGEDGIPLDYQQVKI